MHNACDNEVAYFLCSAGVTDPVGDVNSWIQAFESQYGLRHPRFFRGSYRQALDEAKRDLKFLLVYLHSEDHQHTRKFVV